MASTLEQGRELVGLAERNGLALQVGFVERFRFQSLFQQHFFEADYIEAKRRMPLSLAAEHADLVSDLMIHDIDLVLHAFHQEAPVEIDPVAYGYGPHGYPRLVACRLRFSKNRTADLLASRLHSENERSIRLCDALNSVRIDLSASRVNHWTFSEGTRNPTGETVREAIKLDPLLLQAKSFVQAARGEEKLTVSGAEGVLALQVAEEIKKRLHALASYPFDSDVSWSRVE
jgi:predicted dehydrogenase